MGKKKQTLPATIEECHKLILGLQVSNVLQANRIQELLEANNRYQQDYRNQKERGDILLKRAERAEDQRQKIIDAVAEAGSPSPRPDFMGFMPPFPPRGWYR